METQNRSHCMPLRPEFRKENFDITYLVFLKIRYTIYHKNTALSLKCCRTIIFAEKTNVCMESKKNKRKLRLESRNI